jgi:hypothetical protein
MERLPLKRELQITQLTTMPEATFKKISKNFPEIFLRTKFSGKFFRRKWRIFHGKFCGKFHGKCTGNPFQISLKNSVEISAETGFSAEKMYKKSTPAEFSAEFFMKNVN